MPIAGVVASQLIAMGGGALIVPTGPTLIDFDFINEVYSVNGSSKTASEIITTPGDIGVNGLSIAALGTPNQILGEAATILLGGSTGANSAEWTLVIEFSVATTAATMQIFSLVETPSEVNRDSFQCGYGSTQWQAFDDNAEVTPQRVVVGGAKATGTHKMSVTRTDARLAICVDGGAPFTDEDPVMILDEINAASFGGFVESSNGQAVNIRTFKVYQEQTDTVLQALSE